MMKSMVSQLRAEGKNVSSILSALEDDVARAENIGLGEFSAETAVSEADLDAEFTEHEGEAVALQEPAAPLAARSEPAARKQRRVRNDDSQFQLKF